MNLYHIEIRIIPREGLLDPEGQAVQNALESLEFEDVSDVQVGRLVRMSLSAESTEKAREQADTMCRDFLANPVTEDYQINIENVS